MNLDLYPKTLTTEHDPDRPEAAPTPAPATTPTYRHWNSLPPGDIVCELVGGRYAGITTVVVTLPAGRIPPKIGLHKVFRDGEGNERHTLLYIAHRDARSLARALDRATDLLESRYPVEIRTAR